MFINIRLWLFSLTGLLKAFRLSIPIGVSLFCHIGSFITNSIILAHVSTTYAGSYSLSTSVWHIIFMLIYGVSIYLSRHVANVCCTAKDPYRNNRALQEASALVLFFSFWGSIGCIIILIFLSYFVMPHVVSNDLLCSVQQYLWIMCFGLPGIIFSTFAKSVLDGIHKTYYAMYIAIIMYILNISISLFLLFYSVPPSEFGVVYAMVISWWVIGIISYFYMRYEGLIKYWSLSACICAKKYASQVLYGGLMAASSLLVDVIFLHSISFYMGSHEPILVTAHYMLLHINSLSFVLFPLGLSVGVSIYATPLVARGQWKELLTFIRVSLFFVVIVECLLVATLRYFQQSVFSAYSPDLHIIQAAIEFAPYLWGLIILDGVNVMIVGLLRALDDTKYPAIAYFVGYICIGFITFYTCGKLSLSPFVISWTTILIGLLSLTFLLVMRLLYMMRYVARNYTEGVGIELASTAGAMHV